jgi:hypothetical protein
LPIQDYDIAKVVVKTIDDKLVEDVCYGDIIRFFSESLGIEKNKWWSIIALILL